MSEPNPMHLEDLSALLDKILEDKESDDYEDLQIAVCEFLDTITYDSEESQLLILQKLLEAEIFHQSETSTLFYFFQDICGTSYLSVLNTVANFRYNDWWLYDGRLLNELIENPILPVSMLETILEETEWEGCFLGALRHPNTPEPILQKIFEQGPPKHLYEGDLENRFEIIAGHKNTPLYIVEKLSIHENVQVRTAAFNNPRATEEIRTSAALLGVEYDKVAE